MLWNYSAPQIERKCHNKSGETIAHQCQLLELLIASATPLKLDFEAMSSFFVLVSENWLFAPIKISCSAKISIWNCVFFFVFCLFVFFFVITWCNMFRMAVANGDCDRSFDMWHNTNSASKRYFSRQPEKWHCDAADGDIIECENREWEKVNSR